MGVEITILRVFLYVGMWAIIYEGTIPIFEIFLMLTDTSYFGPTGIKERLQQVKTGEKTRRCNLKRLIRSEIYCVFAALSGTYVLYNQYHHWPMDLIHHWSDTNTILFEIAAGHWLFSIIEDRAAGKHIISHIRYDADEKNSLYLYYSSNLFNHHVITLFAYGYSLYSHKLSALCVFGLLFEAPVIILTYRDICVCFAEELLHPIKHMDEKTLKGMWGVMYLLWHICRTGACLLYPVSLVFWRSQLVTLSILPRLVYHFLGCAFLYVNGVLLFREIPRLIEDDYATNGLVSEDAVRFLRINQRQRGELEDSYDDVTPPPVELKVSGVDSMGKRLLGPKELSKHNTADDLWICIEGHAYDVTAFLEVHPGGAAVLLQCAGTDATAQFLEAGHSQQARRKMARFEVGQMLGHGYDQSGDVEVDDRLMGNLSGPYEMGKVYTTRSDPFADSFVAYTLSLIFIAAVVREMLTRKIYGYSSGSSDGGGGVGMRASLWTAVEPSAVLLLCVSLWCILLKTLTVGTKISLKDLPSTWTALGTPFSYSSMGWALLDWRLHANALLLLLYVACQWTVFSYDVKEHNHALRCIRASLVVSFAAEFVYRKVMSPPRHPDLAMPFKDFVLDLGYSLAPCGLLALAALLDTFTVSVHTTTALMREASRSDGTDVSSAASGESESAGDASTSVLHHAVTIMCMIVATSILRAAVHHQLKSLLSSPGMLTPNSPPLDIFSCVLGCSGIGFAYGCLLHFFFVPSYSASSVLLSMDFNVIILWGASTVILAYSMLNTGAMINWSTRHFAVQMKSIGAMMILWLLAPPIGVGRWVVFLLILGALWFLSDEGDRTLELLAATGQCPKWIYAAKQVENMCRHVVALAIHTLVGQVSVAISSAIAPKGQKYWTYPQPVMDLGPDCDYGMAYQINGKPQKKPGVFQCNVGYIGDDVSDYVHTAGSTREMMEGLMRDKNAGDNGFVTDVVAHFMLSKKREGGYFLREINFNVWESDEAAMQWYRNSKVHKELVKKYYGGGLSSFSAMLASLKPTDDRPIRWDVRCRNCRYMVRGPNPGSCPHCGEKIRPMPYF